MLVIACILPAWLLAAAAEAAGLSVGLLAKLPAVLLEELHQAVVLLDRRRYVDLAGKIGAIDDELGARLRRIVGNLQYQELLDVLNKSIDVRSA